ncbi:FecR domain-containing protein [Larkinella harenae]
MNPKITPELLQRYAQGHCSSEERRTVERWLEQQEDPFEEIEYPLPAEDESLRAEIWAGIPDEPPSRLTTGPFQLVAACVLGLIILGGLWYNRQRTVPKTQPILTEQPQQTVQAPAGELLVVRLPDQSVVWLQGGTTIRYPKKFPASIRSVTLVEGQAFFEVVHHTNRPFIVHSADSQLRVLGTKFVVTNRSRDLRVTLTEGSVQFLTGKKVVQVLTPGQQLQYDKANSVISRLQTVDPNYATAWTRRLLWFRETPLRDVVVDLENYYGVPFQAGPGVDLSRLLTGKFERKPLAHVLRLLANSTGYAFRQQGSTIHIESSH